MGKQRSVYRSYTTSDLKTRADIPAASNITEVDAATDYIDCTNISFTAVKNLIGETTYSLANLCKDSGVNVWSAYGPTKRSVSGGYLVNSAPTNSDGYKLGDFAGYNDDATTPYFINKGSSASTFYTAPTSAHEFRCRIDIGELLYNDIIGITQPTHVAFSVWSGPSTCVDSRVKVIGQTQVSGNQDNGKNIMDFDTNSADRINPGTITYSTTYTLKIWFINTGTFDPAGSNKSFELTELAPWTESVYILTGNHFYMNAPYEDGSTGTGTFTSGPWTITSPTIDSSTGKFGVTAIQTSNYGTYTHAHATVFIELGYYASASPGSWTVITTYAESSMYFDGAFGTYPSYAIGPISNVQAYPSGAMPNGNYGYRIKIKIDPS